MNGAASARPLKLRLLIFLYGNANIGGCALGLLGPALLFAGVIGPGWPLITAGLYGAGWLLGGAVGAHPEIARRIEHDLDAAEMLDRLDALADKVRPHLDGEMNARLGGIRASVAEVLPRLAGARSHDDDLYTVRETVLSYLPETLANYVALPPAFRASHPLKDGKTAHALLQDQLALLDEQLREVVANVAHADAQALLANGRFLEAKFRQPDFLVG